MTTPTQPASYLLSRDRIEAVRLESQHLLWKLNTGYTLHPDIPIKDDMSIADIGAGTSIWALELASQLPPPHRPKYWPANVSFDLLDSLSEVPPSLVGQLDVVHLRMWAFIIRNNDPGPLIRNAAKLLKPGGYLQWEDARFGSTVVRGDAAAHVRQMMDLMSAPTYICFNWLESLDKHVQQADAGMEVLDCKYAPWPSHLVPLCMDTFTLALENSRAALDPLKTISSSVPSQEEWMAGLAALYEDIRKHEGDQLYWLPVALVGRKAEA
ncbi:hypothetical protein BO71DRAFT_488489 [Aspergillus ellipticus CBS 707.79]|uniref:S-adenosyl-L-methionine-dependent methyltransferase n=1 Tax=Aspergillus ellipticus CBS 707.79 TaxID=1448320 RepID=A0A319DCT0_9EURO|nr:hypothetical protein BO71DRAFT_488489 [Aspergillus ellipticus CBS 707.79]